MHLLYRAAHHAVARNIFIGAEDVFCAVVSVHVGGNEIDRHMLLDTMLNECVSPRSLRGGRTAHA